MNKLDFLLVQLPAELRKLNPASKALWGKMNAQQMVEHLSDSVREANGKTPRKLQIPEEKIASAKNFLLSEKEFKPNTKNSLMSEEPLPCRHANMEEAIQELEMELKDFVSCFDNSSEKKITNPFFGDLDFQEWIQLLHKHAQHHLKQFAV